MALESILGHDRVQRQNRLMALSLLAASGGLLYYYLNKEDRDRNHNYGQAMSPTSRRMEDSVKGLKNEK